MPSDTATRPSSSDRSSRRVSSEPKPAEICAVGPSRPPDPPEPIVTALVMVFTRIARARIARGSVCTASIALSVPCPSASGANFATSQCRHQRAAERHQRDRPWPVESGRAGVAAVTDCVWGRRSRRDSRAGTGRRSRARGRRRTAPRPAMMPIEMPRISHLRRYPERRMKPPSPPRDLRASGMQRMLAGNPPLLSAIGLSGRR